MLATMLATMRATVRVRPVLALLLASVAANLLDLLTTALLFHHAPPGAVETDDLVARFGLPGLLLLKLSFYAFVLLPLPLLATLIRRARLLGRWRLVPAAYACALLLFSLAVTTLADRTNLAFLLYRA